MSLKMLCELARQNRISFKSYGFNLFSVAEMLQKLNAALNKEVCRTSFTLPHGRKLSRDENLAAKLEMVWCFQP